MYIFLLEIYNKRLSKNTLKYKKSGAMEKKIFHQDKTIREMKWKEKLKRKINERKKKINEVNLLTG